jgi:hypothetical protein
MREESKNLGAARGRRRPPHFATAATLQICEATAKGARTLNELLARCDPKALRGREERNWLDAKPVGRELI